MRPTTFNIYYKLEIFSYTRGESRINKFFQLHEICECFYTILVNSHFIQLI